MSLPDCIKEYKSVGEEVFGWPCFFSTVMFMVGKRENFVAATLKNVFEDVTARRTEHLSEPDTIIISPSSQLYARRTNPILHVAQQQV